jgi:catechol 2,3-dioxygenase-like lactoylglutathione lyase family enzyme
MNKTMKAAVFAVAALSAMRLSAQSAGGSAASAPLNLEFHHATASVANMSRAIKWYEEKLGFKVTLHKQLDANTDLAWLVIPGFRVDLIQYKGSSRGTVPINHLSTQGWAHIVFAVPNVDRAYEMLKARGVSLPEPVVTLNELHIRTSHFPDSEGNWLEIYQDVPASSSK